MAAVAEDRPMPTTVGARLEARAPYAHAELLGFLAARAVPGVEAAGPGGYRRSLRLAGGPALLAAEPDPDGVLLRLTLSELADRAEAEALARRLFGLDQAADPGLVDAAIAADPVLATLVARRPGLRVPGQVDGFELAVRAVLGQQVTVKGAATLAARVVARLGQPLPPALAGVDPALTHLFPAPAAVAGGDLGGLGLTGARARTLAALAAAVAGGLALDPGADRAAARAGLLALPGIGPWTVEYVAMRALRDPDAIPLGDLGLAKAHAHLTGAAGPGPGLAAAAERWRPWRATAAMHLWAHSPQLDTTQGYAGAG